MKAKEIVQQHLRTVEAGNWDNAISYIVNDYTMTGTIPFPINVFVRIRKYVPNNGMQATAFPLRFSAAPDAYRWAA
jgi:hypothetical protein